MNNQECEIKQKNQNHNIFESDLQNKEKEMEEYIGFKSHIYHVERGWGNDNSDDSIKKYIQIILERTFDC